MPHPSNPIPLLQQHHVLCTLAAWERDQPNRARWPH